jgi:DNA-binding beta-propeller fold protein YncE
MKRIFPLLFTAVLALAGIPQSMSQESAGEKPSVDPQLGDVTGKSPEVVAAIKKLKTRRGFDASKNTARKPKIYAALPAELHGPDGMAVNPKTGTLFLSVPNFNRRPGDTGKKLHPAYIATVSPEGKTEIALNLDEIENIKLPTGQIGPMGLTFGPDGHLYVCDNQYFFDTKNKSRILRVLMDGDKPTGKVEVVVDGTKLSNAIMWLGNHLYLTDTFFDLEGHFGSGGVWQFSKQEILKAGSGENPPIKVKPIKKMGDDPHLLVLVNVRKIPGCGNGGPDGMTADSNGTIYFGNFGNGEIHRIVLRANRAAVDVIHPAGQYFNCCDGIYYDKGTNKVYITDSAANAVHAFTPPAARRKPKFETIWENGNTDGADGSLDQPCEAVVIGKKLILVNFDWPFPELLNTKSEDPATLSVIELE